MAVARARLLEPLYKIDVPLTHAAAGRRRRRRRHDCRPAPSATWATRSTSSSAATSWAAWLHEHRHDDQGQPSRRVRRGARAASSSTTRTSRSTSRPSSSTSRASSATSTASSARATASAHPSSTAWSSWPQARAKTGRRSSAWVRARRIVTGLDLEALLAKDDELVSKAGAVGFMLCAGSLDTEFTWMERYQQLVGDYCSRTCCAQSVKNAIRLKEADPDAAGLRLVQGAPHLRSPRGVLHEGARARRHLRALRQRLQAAGERRRRRGHRRVQREGVR